MDTVFEEEHMQYVCFERNNELILTEFVQFGSAISARSVKLTPSEVFAIKSGAKTAKWFVGSFSSSRYLKKEIWPSR
ncbi:hypothetical protein V8125_001404 [Vibrio vulnificus]|nr:hypothetical protein [Vibrio parahaemolyticus]